MTNQEEKYYVGIDVSKSMLDVCVLPSRKYSRYENTKKGIEALKKVLLKLPNALIVMESTGGYEKSIEYALKKEGLRVCVKNPRPIRDFAKSMGRLAKTDKIDGETIALYAERIQPEPDKPLDEQQIKLAKLNARRKQLVNMISSEKNRLDKADKDIIKSINSVIKGLQKELDKIEKSLHELIAGNDEYQQLIERLTAVKGIGNVVAAVLIADLPELGSLTSRQVAALVGLAPYNRDSGTLRGKRTIWGGRASVRTALYMATLSAIRHNVKLKKFYLHLIERGKKKKVAITACMRKLLISINAMIKNNSQWQSC